MANLLWGKVYYKEIFAGYLREEPGDRTSFAYDEIYLNSGNPPIAHTLPLRIEPYITHGGLHPFFDNLVAEGWLEAAQTKLIDKRQASRFELLLSFGFDCAGAVSIVDTENPIRVKDLIDINDPREISLLQSQSSLSGIQPKLTLVKRHGKIYPTKMGELSTHIAKFPSAHHDDLVTNEYLTTLAFKTLLPEDDVVELYLGEIQGLDIEALIIKRFDRGVNVERIHFEEFNQLLGKPSKAKYQGSHKEMSDFIKHTKNCIPLESFKLFKRILAGIVLGNTDMHLKNFAMYHTDAGLRLTPSYDQVSAVLYNYKTMALAIAGTSNLRITDLNERHIIRLAREFELPDGAIRMVYEQFSKNLNLAKDAVAEGLVNNAGLKDQIIQSMEKRWNGTFSKIGKSL